MSQRDIARRLGLSPATMTKLKKRGCPMHSAEAVAEWRRRNVNPYSRPDAPPPPPRTAPAGSVASPADDGEDLDIGRERALLVREQRREIAARNFRNSGEFAPVSLMTASLAAAAAAFAERMDHLPGLLRRKHPNLSPEAIGEVLATVAAARNAFVDEAPRLLAGQVEALAAALDEDDDDDADPAADEAPA